MKTDPSHQPGVLFRASIERMDGAYHALDQGDYALSLYLAGLAVECILQAFALRNGAAHDARHRLPHWLSKCPRELQDAFRSPPLGGMWSELVAVWDNSLRYLSNDGVLNYLQRKGFLRRLKGDPQARMKAYSKHLVETANQIQAKGLTRWHSSKN